MRQSHGQYRLSASRRFYILLALLVQEGSCKQRLFRFHPVSESLNRQGMEPAFEGLIMKFSISLGSTWSADVTAAPETSDENVWVKSLARNRHASSHPRS
jgi:hypothetical protein